MQLSYMTAGESHGPSLSVIVSGLPSGLGVHREYIDAQLRRRQAGYGRSPRQRIEHDRIEVTGGVRHGRVLGGPVAMQVANRDHASWDAAMAVWEGDALQGNWRDRVLTVPRPGHADLGGIARGDFSGDGLRPVLERASARETAARVAAGALAELLLAELGIVVRAHVRAVGAVGSAAPVPAELDPAWATLDGSQLRCLDPTVDARMVEEVDAARADRDTLGGVIEVVAYGCPPGIGGYATSKERLDGRLAGAVLSVQAMKSVTIGCGDEAASQRGSAAHDEMQPMAGAADRATGLRAGAGAVGGDQGMGVTRATNRAGGIEGGMSNGAPIVVRAAMKPLPTLMRPLATVDLATGSAATAHAERSDTCATAAAAVVLQAAVAFELATVIREQLGAQALADVLAAWVAYRTRVCYPQRPGAVLDAGATLE